jgi:hypothetical protein
LRYRPVVFQGCAPTPLRSTHACCRLRERRGWSHNEGYAKTHMLNVTPATLMSLRLSLSLHLDQCVVPPLSPLSTSVLIMPSSLSRVRLLMRVPCAPSIDGPFVRRFVSSAARVVFVGRGACPRWNVRLLGGWRSMLAITCGPPGLFRNAATTCTPWCTHTITV